MVFNEHHERGERCTYTSSIYTQNHDNKETNGPHIKRGQSNPSAPRARVKSRDKYIPALSCESPVYILISYTCLIGAQQYFCSVFDNHFRALDFPA